MAEQATASDTTQSVVTQSDVTQQVTSLTPTTRPKNPKRVAAGKAVAERTRQAREAQKKALAEATMAEAPARPSTGPAPVPAPVPVNEPRSDPNIQWLAIGSIVISLVGLYYKREEIKALCNRPAAQTAQEPKPVVQTAQEPTPAKAPNPGKGFRRMD